MQEISHVQYVQIRQQENIVKDEMQSRHLTDCLLIIDLTFPQQWSPNFSSAGKTPVRMRNNIQAAPISRPASSSLLQLPWNRSDLAAAVLSWMGAHLLDKGNKLECTHALLDWGVCLLGVRILRCGNVY